MHVAVGEQRSFPSMSGVGLRGYGRGASKIGRSHDVRLQPWGARKGLGCGSLYCVRFFPFAGSVGMDCFVLSCHRYATAVGDAITSKKAAIARHCRWYWGTRSCRSSQPGPWPSRREIEPSFPFCSILDLTRRPGHPMLALVLDLD